MGISGLCIRKTGSFASNLFPRRLNAERAPQLKCRVRRLDKQTDYKIKEPGLTTALYERLAGHAWHQVAEAVRLVHPGTGNLRARGVFRVQHGPGYIARLLAGLLRLPRPADATSVELHIIPSEDGEKWVRTFGRQRLVTLQYEAPGHLLAERFGLLEFRFQLRPQAEALSYLQQEVAVCFGRLRLWLPSWLAPQVNATEKAVEATQRTHSAVNISLPFVGLLISYEGELEVEKESE